MGVHTMKPFVRLDARDQEHLVMTMERSLDIKTRSQFYLWAQGALQGFIAHDALWCAHGNLEHMRLQVESFSGALQSTQHDTQLTDPANGLLPRLVDEWLRSGRNPLLLSTQSENQMGRRQLIMELGRLGYGHVTVHGVREQQGDQASLFVFAGMDHLPNSRDAYLLDMLMPHLHLALRRMLQHSGNAASADMAPVTLLSKRELQVLHWVKNGKTNQEIGQILGISPPTVKNHLQKIMRKLNVNNRAQAVGKSATLRLMAHTDLA
jgi:transcriptional regulator EpsA